MAKVEDIARVCHETNRVWSALNGDASQPTWEDAPDWQKESAISGVKFVIENPNVPPHVIHDEWAKRKIKGGWIYGKEKDEAARTHPCLAPYEELPEWIQQKDTLFKMIVMSLWNGPVA